MPNDAGGCPRDAAGIGAKKEKIKDTLRLAKIEKMLADSRLKNPAPHGACAECWHKRARAVPRKNDGTHCPICREFQKHEELLKT